MVDDKDKTNILQFPAKAKIASSVRVAWGPIEDKKASVHLHFMNGAQLSLTPSTAFELSNVLSQAAMAAWHYNKMNGLEEELKKE